MAKKPSTTTTLEDFLEQHDAEPENYDEVDTLNFERDELYEVTILSHHQFDGKFGPSVVIIYYLMVSEDYGERIPRLEGSKTNSRLERFRFYQRRYC